MNKNKRIWFCVAVLLMILGAQCVYSAVRNGQVMDEDFFSASGYAMVRYNNYEFLGEQPPLISQIGAIPLAFLKLNFPILDPTLVPNTDRIDVAKNGRRFLYQMGNDPNLILFLERIPIVLLTILLGFGIFRFARELYGNQGALLALFFYVFSPDVISLGSLYMTDMGLTVFYFYTLYALKRFFDAPSERKIVLLGLACGAAFMSKISSLILLPVITCLFLIYYLTGRKGTAIKAPTALFEKWVLGGIAFYLVLNAVGERQAMVLFGPFLVFAVYLGGRDLPWVKSSQVWQLIFRGLVILGAVLCAVLAWRLKKKYGISAATMLMLGMLLFAGIAALFARLPSSDDRVKLLKYFLAVWVLAAMVIVLGYTDFVYKFYRFIGFGNYTKPLGIVLSHLKGGHGGCLEGSLVTCDQRYFYALLAIKMPILALVLSIFGLFLLLRSSMPVLSKAILTVPVVFFLGSATFSKINIGLRHILPIFPFLFIWAGFSAAALAAMKRGFLKYVLSGGLCVMLGLLAVRTLGAAPDYNVYFNEAVGGAEEGARLIPINGGQNNKDIAEFALARKIQSIKIATEAENTDVYDYYKLRWQRMKESDFLSPEPGFYAVGIGVYTEQQKHPRSWFYKRKPDFKLGKTVYIFEAGKGP